MRPPAGEKPGGLTEYERERVWGPWRPGTVRSGVEDSDGARAIVPPPWPGGFDPRTVDCVRCGGTGVVTWPSEDGGSPPLVCPGCNGIGKRL